MPDLFANWAALAAAEVLGVDYRLPYRYNSSKTVCIAIHGGAIEPGTTEVASSVAARCRHNFYSLEGIKASGNSDLHITSTNYDEPIGTALVKSMDYCFSMHGMADQTAGVAETYVGGLDTVSRDAVISALQGAGFTASVGNNELNGTDPANITNKTTRAMGIQLEMSNTQRQQFFTSNDLSRSNRETGVRTETFYKYVRAVASVANNLGGGVAQTSNYFLNTPTPSDSMADFETWLNSNWEKLRKATGPLSGSTLPQSGPWNIGDRFYYTPTNSIYILVTKDTNWGWYWRPVQDAISPWFTVPNTAMNISGWTLSKVGAKPVAIALDNRGKCYWRGTVGPTSGNITRNSSVALFKPLPDGIRPRQRSTFMCGHETVSVGIDGTLANSFQGARVFLSENPITNGTVRAFGGTADFNTIHFNGVNYAVGIGKYWTP